MKLLRSLCLAVPSRLVVPVSSLQAARVPRGSRFAQWATLLAAFTLSAAGARAATLTVNTTADSSDSAGSCATGICSLRDAITQAGASDTIDFSITGTITLTGNLPVISQSLTITGPGANQLAVSGAGSYGVFQIGSAANVILSGLAITRGVGPLSGGVSEGGGLVSGGTGTVTVQNCAFTGNSATSGGAIYNSGALYISGSTFSSNSATNGGAIYSVSGGNITLTNDTFAKNSASAGAGAIQNAATLTVNNSTFYGNSALGGSGGAIVSSDAAANLTANNNVFVNNSATSSGGAVSDSTASTSSVAYNVYYNNLVSGSESDCYQCSETHAVSASANPLALPFGYYGGTTKSLLPQPGSAAICAGLAHPGSGLTTDQRGFAVAPSYSQCSSGSIDSGAIQTNYIQVQNNGDAGAGSSDCPGSGCTLRDAVALAGSAGDIDFSSTLTTINLSNTNGAVSLNAATGVEIVGRGANLLTIHGNASSSNSYSVFTVNAGTQALLYGLTITGGYGANGGGVSNQGELSVLGTQIAGNTATGNGGGIDNNGGLLSLANSTISGNQSGGNGAGISSESTGATATILETTISGNSFSVGGTGGGIDNGGSMTVTGSTIWNNSNSTGAGGIVNSGTLTLANSIVANNASSLGAANISGTYTNAGGDVIGGSQASNTANAGGTGSAIALSSLQLNGASDSVPTLIPLPGGASGNPVICAGSASNVPFDTLTDERGYPVENTTYSGYSQATPCVDAGAVQTNYSMSFTSSPTPSTLTVDQGFAAAVTLNENGAAFAESSVSIPVTASSGTLYGSGVTSGVASASTSAGIANFSGLTATVGAGNSLTSTLALNTGLTSPLSLTAASSSFDVTQASTSISLSPSSQTSTVDSAVPITATVMPSGVTNQVSASYLVPMTSTVTFFVAGSAIGDCTALPVIFDPTSGHATATCNTTQLKSGSGEAITAQYNSGDTNYAASAVSGSVSVTINAAATSLSLVSDSGANSSTGATGSSAVNQSVTFTATVSAPAGASVPMVGNVTFTDNGASITKGSGSCGKSGVVAVTWNTSTATATAACTTSALSGGSHAIVAAYNKDNSDSNYLGSNNNVTQNVGLLATTVTAPTASPTSPTVNQPVTVTATVAPSSGGTLTVDFSGNMEFFNNGAPISNCTSVSVTPTSTGATASCALSNLTASTTAYQITAQYKSGDTNYSASSVSSPFSLTVSKASVNMQLSTSSAGNTSTVNQPVVFTATVTANPTGSTALSGTVAFTDNGAPISNCSAVTPSLSGGVATCTDTSLDAQHSPHTIIAAYSKDANFTSNSQQLVQTTNPASTSTVLSSSANPSVVDQQVTFTAIVTPAPGAVTLSNAGTVNFTDSATGQSITNCSARPVTVNSGVGQATCATSALTVDASSPHTITATYGNDPNFSGSNGALLQTVRPVSTSIVLTSSGAISVNQPVTLMASITASPTQPALAGSVAFIDSALPSPGTIPNCSAQKITQNPANPSLWQATCTDAGLTAGSHTITAVYGTDPNFAVGNGTLTQMVTRAPSSVSITGGASIVFVQNPNSYKDSVSFLASVTPTNGIALSGSVTFNGVLSCQGAIAGAPATLPVSPTTGQATCITTSLPGGSQTITASYTGDSNYSDSSSLTAGLNQAVTLTVSDYAINVQNLPTTSASGLQVTQGYATATDTSGAAVDPFAPAHPVAVAPTSIGSYSSSAVTITCTSTAAAAPTCLPGGASSATLQIAAGSIVQGAVNLTIDASGASVAPGTYTFTVTANDAATGLIRTATFPVTVRSALAGANALALVSGATTNNSATLNFALPQGVTLSNLTCAEVVGTGITSAEAPSSVGIGCSFNPSSLGPGSSTGPRLVPTNVTLTTNNSIAAIDPPNVGRRRPLLLVAGFLLPLFGLMGIRRDRKSIGATFLRMIAIAAIALVGFQTLGCGGSYHSGNVGVSGGTTPPGQYYLLVQGTGSDGKSYQAVLEVNVNL